MLRLASKNNIVRIHVAQLIQNKYPALTNENNVYDINNITDKIYYLHGFPINKINNQDIKIGIREDNSDIRIASLFLLLPLFPINIITYFNFIDIYFIKVYGDKRQLFYHSGKEGDILKLQKKLKNRINELNNH